MNKEQNFEAVECVEEVVETCELPGKTGGNKIVKASLIGLGVVAIAGTITALVRKHKKSFDDLMVKKLVKKGYTVVPPLDNAIDADVDSEVDSMNN